MEKIKSSELFIDNGSDTLVVSFGGYAKQMGGILPFEFLNFLQKNFPTVDKLFYIDKHRNSYHKGIKKISTNIPETVKYLSNKVKTYKSVTFIGNSSGGYAAILFGSLVENVQKVIAFIPQTILHEKNKTCYTNLRTVINSTTQYHIYGDLSATGTHHISHCENIEHFPNVNVTRMETVNLKNMKESGELLLYLKGDCIY
jgi:hypothetical protein